MPRVRLGAENVHLVYRRSETEMPAFQFEYEHAKVEGVPLPLDGAARRDRRRDGRAAAVEFLRTQLGAPDATGRRIPNRFPAANSRWPATW